MAQCLRQLERIQELEQQVRRPPKIPREPLQSYPDTPQSLTEMPWDPKVSWDPPKLRV